VSTLPPSSAATEAPAPAPSTALPHPNAAPAPTLAVDAPPAPKRGGKDCGMSTDDWCPAPSGDACGRHKDVAACKADPKCKGMRYRGESFAPCKDDGSGFTPNCPTVGCISR